MHPRFWLDRDDAIAGTDVHMARRGGRSGERDTGPINEYCSATCRESAQLMVS